MTIKGATKIRDPDIGENQHITDTVTSHWMMKMMALK